MPETKTNIVTDNHMERPVYLTNCLCDPAFGSTALLDSLGLDYERRKDLVVKGYSDTDYGVAFPLTKAEEQFIAPYLMVGKAFGGGAMVGHSSLYLGRKWLMPCIDVCYLGTRTFTDESYNGTAFNSKAGAEKAANQFADSVRPSVTAAGGHVFVRDDVESDRIVIQMLFPFSFAEGLGAEQWINYVEKLVNDHATVK